MTPKVAKQEWYKGWREEVRRLYGTQYEIMSGHLDCDSGDDEEPDDDLLFSRSKPRLWSEEEDYARPVRHVSIEEYLRQVRRAA